MHAKDYLYHPITPELYNTTLCIIHLYTACDISGIQLRSISNKIL